MTSADGLRAEPDRRPQTGPARIERRFHKTPGPLFRGASGIWVLNKELVLRSKLRIEARQFHMSRLHPQQWGERQEVHLKDDWNLLSEEERRRKADELIAMIRELREPPMQPPPRVYRWEELPEEREPVGIGWQPRPAAESKG